MASQRDRPNTEDSSCRDHVPLRPTIALPGSPSPWLRMAGQSGVSEDPAATKPCRRTGWAHDSNQSMVEFEHSRCSWSLNRSASDGERRPFFKASRLSNVQQNRRNSIRTMRGWTMTMTTSSIGMNTALARIPIRTIRMAPLVTTRVRMSSCTISLLEPRAA